MPHSDPFDGEIERLFARPMTLEDAEGFARRIDRRLESGWRLRAVLLTAAGGAGGFFALRETLGSNLVTGLANESSQGATSVAEAANSGDWGRLFEGFASGLLGLDMTALASMPLFWAASAVLIGAAVFTATRAANTT